MAIEIGDWDLGRDWGLGWENVIRDWGLVLGIWNWDWGLGLGIGIGDSDWGSVLTIGCDFWL